MEEQTRTQAPVYLTANIRGVVLPTWLAVALGLSTFIGALTLAGVLFVGSRMLSSISAQIEIQRQEIRVLELHVQDVENAIIRAGVSTRREFAPWDRMDKDESQSTKKGETQ